MSMRNAPFRWGRGVVLCLLLACTTACLPFQRGANPFRLKPSQYVKVGPKRWLIHYREAGRPGNPAVVFVHGYGSASVVWIPLMRKLASMGYHCLAVDLPGFGLSDKIPGNYETTNIADTVALFMKRKGVEKADVIAHSWGSSVTLALAVRHPQKVRRIVINSGWVFSAQLIPFFRWSKIPLFGEILYGLFYTQMPGEKLAHSVYDAHRFAKQPIVEVVKKAYKRPGALAAALAVARGMNFEETEKKYRNIKQQTLLQWGSNDRVALPFYGRRLVSTMPNARLVFLNRCGHMPMMERPNAFIRNISQFLGPANKVKTSYTFSKAIRTTGK